MTKTRANVRATLREGRRDWFQITAKAKSTTAQVYIYDEIGYWGVTASDFAAALNALDGITEIDLRLNSPGGEVFEGVAIYNTLKNHPATVRGTVDGWACSAASFIAMACDTLAMGTGSQLMIHDASGICVGQGVDMRSMADRLDGISDTIAGFYKRKAGGSLASWRDAMRAETWYNSEEAVAAGLADSVTEPDEEESEPDAPEKNSWDLSVFAYAGRENAPPPPVIVDETETPAADPPSAPEDPQVVDGPVDEEPPEAPTPFADLAAAFLGVEPPALDDWSALVADLTDSTSPDQDDALASWRERQDS